MQFVANGPDVPNELLQAHEEGEVVFFCGAGVSYPAGLPGFEGLVDKIYDILQTAHTALERKAYSKREFDVVLDLLERRLPDAKAMRKALQQALTTKARRKGATDTHSALLRLSRDRKGLLRIVTTNFDRLFDLAARRAKETMNVYAAPMLPIPKRSRWNGLVHLHGAIPKGGTDKSTPRLVVTSGDFGAAYLNEGWAARFATELLSNYTVCFVGYSIDDPVLRYMLDALAADRAMGEATPQAYVFGSFSSGSEDAEDWQSKGDVRPILYEVSSDSGDHSALHDTLKNWANTYRDGATGKERIVVDYGLTHPTGSTKQDNFVDRMLWAIADSSGLPAKRFAELDPVPSFEWFEEICRKCHRHADLPRFGVSPNNNVDSRLRFSLVNRPTPYSHAAWMSPVVDPIGNIFKLDQPMFWLARWLLRHLNNPNLLIWVSNHGGRLHPQFSGLVGDALDSIPGGNSQAEARSAEIRKNAPDAIPEPSLATLWRLCIAGRVGRSFSNLDLLQCCGRVKTFGLTTAMRVSLRELLAPRVTLSASQNWGSSLDQLEDTEVRKPRIQWNLVLATSDVRTALSSFSESESSTLAQLLSDFEQLLMDALCIARDLGSNVRKHGFVFELPSISRHNQNQGRNDWTVLVELLGGAWLAASKRDSKHTASVAVQWFDRDIALFKRLALFAASQDSIIADETWVGWVVSDSGRWLWSSQTKREVMRLLVRRGGALSDHCRQKLETEILKSPPDPESSAPDDDDNWQVYADKAVWLRLSKLGLGGEMGNEARVRLNELRNAYPDWQIAPNDSDEFAVWISGSGDPDFEDKYVRVEAPTDLDMLVNWLQESQPDSHWHVDNWQEVCRTDFRLSLNALCTLGKKGDWPIGRWREALQAWSEKGTGRRSWRFAAPLVEQMPDCVFEEMVHQVAWWLKAASDTASCYNDIFVGLCIRVLNCRHSDDLDRDDPVGQAINHSVGYITQALVNKLLRQNPNDNDKLPSNVRDALDRLFDLDVLEFRHGRVILASKLVFLFRLDRSWSEANLLPLFDWSTHPLEARALWEGFLWSPRIYSPLLIALKPSFLDTASHYEELGGHSRQFAAFLTFVALASVEGFDREGFSRAIAALPQNGLREVAHTMATALDGSGNQREDYWENRIKPFWEQCWPKDKALVSAGTAKPLALLSIAAGNKFPDAVDRIQGWLVKIRDTSLIVHRMKESGLCKTHPEKTLEMLFALIDDDSWVVQETRPCMHQMLAASPTLADDQRYKFLDDILRASGY